MSFDGRKKNGRKLVTVIDKVSKEVLVESGDDAEKEDENILGVSKGNGSSGSI